MNSAEIRKTYLTYFKNHGHTVVPSDGLIPSGDPTLLFTSAGMVQFKKHFLGQSSDTFTRASTCQKCFRTSDIDQVGQTNRHLTFFEMLGNFSFGDYFKQDAIAWGWEFLTKTMALPKEKLYITVYKDDQEAYDLWKKIIPESMIIRMGDETNFWNMGPTGPCGPCSEILYDLGPEMSCGKPDCGPACSCNRYLEVWNLVFTQFDRQPDGSLKNLPRKNIDTGMGLERLVAVAQGKKNVFDTDLFMPLIQSISSMLQVPVEGNLPALRMMADHARAITMLAADGILPSNEGRGYVLRRILRRALRQGRLFGAPEAFLYRITVDVAAIMQSAYPELTARRESIAAVTKREEDKFLETLEAGTRLLDEMIAKYKFGKKNILPGAEVFKLYDTYGFPPDLTREIAAEQGMAIDEPGFQAAQKTAQEKSRAGWSGSGEKDLTFYATVNKETGNTEFVGYDATEATATVKALLKDGARVPQLSAGESGEAVLDRSPFYAESGGQVGDTGTLTAANGSVHAAVTDTKKPIAGLFVHQIKATKGSITVGQQVQATVDGERRLNIMRHHTATHLLHKALRQVVGNQATQAGSLVTPDGFRFDFAHGAPVKPEELRALEEHVNAAIRANMPVVIRSMSLQEARTAGAMALFGEKYGETVRSVTVSCDSDSDTKPFSMELCGGTHVKRTGDIGFFKITTETSVAAGTRRIEAVAGRAAEQYVQHRDTLLDETAYRLKSSPAELAPRVDRLLAHEKELEREISKLKSQLASGDAQDLMKNVRDVGGINVLAASMQDIDAKTLRELADNFKAKLNSGIVILASAEPDKLSFIVSITPDLVKAGKSAGALAKKLAGAIGGSGGGKPDFAQGGGKDPSRFDAALKDLSALLS